MVNEVAEREERKRDLKSQIAELSAERDGEIIFMHISPGREPVTVYRAKTGEPVEVPAYMVRAVMEKDEDGRPMFVARKEDAPEYKLGTIKCFLHADSPERPILEEIGLSGVTCAAAHLASQHAKRQHGLHRHKQEWAALQEYIEDEKEEKREARLDKQLEATLAVAKGADRQAAAPASSVAEATSVRRGPGRPKAVENCQNCGGIIEGALADHQCIKE